MANFSFVLVAAIAMSASAVAASVIHHYETAHNSADKNFLALVIISSGTKDVCSGVILNEHWVITAAHCIEKYTSFNELKVTYGSHNRNEALRISTGVEKIVIHPEYHQRLLVNNVAIVKVTPNIEFNATVQPATLPTVETEEDESAYAIGWEKTDIVSQSSENLKKHETKIMAMDLCWERLEDLDAVDVNDNVICTYGTTEEPISDLDIGSALFSFDKNELIGIASLYGQRYPSVYVRIRSYLSWINSTIQQA